MAESRKPKAESRNEIAVSESEVPQPQPTGEKPAAAPTPIPAIFLCRSCRKGRLDAAGRKPGEDMTCPNCGKPTKVNLEHTLGEEHVAQRQKAREAARVPFHDLPEEKQLELLSRKTGVEKLWFRLMHRLGPKGMVVLYLGIVISLAAALIAYVVIVLGWRFKDHPWWYWLVAVGVGVGAGLAGFVGWVTFTYYRDKRCAAAGAAKEQRASGRRR